MRRKNKLNFANARAEKAKRMRAFILSFTAFILVFGAVSLLIFMKSLDFDLGNLAKGDEGESTTTEETTEAPSQVQAMDANILLVCYDTNNHLSLLAFVSSEKDAQQISVSLLDTAQAYTKDGTQTTLQACFANSGMAGLKSAVEQVYGAAVDRYIKVSESNLKKVISKIGDVSVEVVEPIQYRGSDYSLFLDGGVQMLTGDLFIKYLKYTSGSSKAQAVCALVQTTLNAFREDNRDSMFNSLVNLSDTDISVVDNTDSGGLVSVYISLRANVVAKEGQRQKGEVPA